MREYAYKPAADPWEKGSWSHLLGQWKKKECSPYETAENKWVIRGQGIIDVTAWNRYVGWVYSVHSFVDCLSPQDTSGKLLTKESKSRILSLYRVFQYVPTTCSTNRRGILKLLQTRTPAWSFFKLGHQSFHQSQTRKYSKQGIPTNRVPTGKKTWSFFKLGHQSWSIPKSKIL